MDYDFNSSDILFPGQDNDLEISKLSTPMRKKVPESIDWASYDLANTFNDKTAHLLDQYVGFNQRIKTTGNVYDKNEEQPQGQYYYFEPLRTTETSFDERILLFTDNLTFEEDRKQKTIDNALDMIKEDIEKSNSSRYPLNFNQELFSWEDEIYKDYNAVGSIDSFSDIKPKLCRYPNDIGLTDDYYSSSGCAFQRNDHYDICVKEDETIDSPSKNRKQSSKISKITNYFKTRLEKTKTVLFH